MKRSGRKLTAAIVGALAMMGVASSALAQGPNYNYVQGGYQFWTGGGSVDGFFVDGSFAVNRQIYIAAGYDTVGYGDWDMDRLTLLGGFHQPLARNMDFYLEGGLARTSGEVCVPFFGCFSHSDTGLLLGGGVRMMTNRNLEVHGGLRLITGDYDETYLTAGAAYQFAPSLSGLANMSYMTDASEFRFQLGLRYGF